MGAQKLYEESNPAMYVNRGDQPAYMRIIDEDAAPAVLAIPDYHDGLSSLEQAVDQFYDLAPDKNKYVLLGDMTDAKDKATFVQKYNIPTKGGVQRNYVLNNVLENDDERQVYNQIAFIEEQGGVQSFLGRLYQAEGQEKAQSVAQQIESLYKQADELNLVSKVNMMTADQKEELMQHLAIADVHHNAIYNAFDKFCARRDAAKIKEINEKYDNKFKFLLDSGNHASIVYIEEMEDLLKDTVYDINKVGGAVQLGKGDDAYNVQFAGNVYGFNIGLDAMLLSEEQRKARFPYQYQDTGVLRDATHDLYEQMKDKFMTDNYQRIKFESEEQKYDTLFLHDGVGQEKIGYEDQSKNFPAHDDVGLLKILQEDLVPQEKYGGNGLYACGHLHKDGEGAKEEWGLYESRKQFAIYSKQDGQVQIQDLDVKHEKAPIDDEEILRLYQEELEFMQTQLRQQQEMYANNAGARRAA
jgi:hypothetical protein